MWQGQTVAVLASGPSMSLKLSQSLRRPSLRVAVANSTFRLAPWADLLVAADADWWRANPDAREFQGLKVCADDSLLWPEVLSLRHTGKVGFDDDKECIRSGGNTGYQAVHIAAQAGASRILLFGFDMRPGHWHDVDREADEAHYAEWCRRFATLAVALAGRVEVLNCTPGSALECFPMATIDEAL